MLMLLGYRESRTFAQADEAAGAQIIVNHRKAVRLHRYSSMRTGHDAVVVLLAFLQVNLWLEHPQARGLLLLPRLYYRYHEFRFLFFYHHFTPLRSEERR